MLLLKSLLCLFLLSVPLAAQAACVSTNKSNLTQEQINLVPILAYQVAVAAGHNERPTVTETATQLSICFNTFNPAGVITLAAMQAAYNAQIAADQATATADTTNLQAAKDEWQTKLTALGFSQNAITVFFRLLLR